MHAGPLCLESESLPLMCHIPLARGHVLSGSPSVEVTHVLRDALIRVPDALRGAPHPVFCLIAQAKPIEKGPCPHERPQGNRISHESLHL